MRRLLAVVIAFCLLVIAVPAQADDLPRSEEVRVRVGAEPDGTPVELDVTRFVPTGGGGPFPVLILTHGFGGSKDDLSDRATDFAAQGYLVYTYTARGFGKSGGRIHLNDPAFEGADLSAIVDQAAKDPDATLDAAGDPRVGVTGASYGGAVQVLTAATDRRIDAIAPVATWSNLESALFPNHAVAADEPGPLQQQWLAGFFAAAVRPGPAGPPAQDPACGRFEPTLCRQLLAAAQTGHPSAELREALRQRSPISVAATVSTPALLVQGLADSLFGVDQSDALEQALARAGTPHAVYWTDGGHDAPSSDPDADQAAVDAWFNQHLKGAATNTPRFSWPGPRPFGEDRALRYTSEVYPGLNPGNPVRFDIDADPQPVLNPPGGQPASITRTGTPGGNDDPNNPFQAYPLAALPGQSAAFDTPAVRGQHRVVGAPMVHLTVTSSAQEVTFFISLWLVNGATASQPRPGVAPVRLPVTPGRPTQVVVALPGGSWSLEPAGTWRVLVTSTDSAYANDTTGRVDQVVVTSMEFPTFTGTPAAADTVLDTELVGVLAALVVALAVFTFWGLRFSRARTRLPFRAELATTPVVVEDLSKAYPDGHQAVSGVGWRAEPGQVVGLLGPNGAGKTTTLRMVLGLIRPDAGGVWVLGRPVTSGAQVLRDVGALVEGPGFLPHLTGRQNLDAYWAATGRPRQESGLDEALEVAALGGALDRPVKTYSHGMRQRLGIAQAMLGRPDLLILDEPTNGLDPPQIAALRPILRAYAATGRTVVISSHLLAEVEQTCTHVVVMDAGRVLVSGPVEDLLADHDTSVLVTASPVSPIQMAALRAIDGITLVNAEEDTRLVVEADLPRAAVVRAAVDAGLDLVEVSGTRHLEELFLSVIGQGRGPGEGTDATTMADRLRQVRPR